MPPAVAAAGITAGAGLVGGALDRRSQNKAAEKSAKQSARDFAFFSQPLLNFGQESMGYGRDFLGSANRQAGIRDRLYGDAESKLQSAYEGLGPETFKKASDANLKLSLSEANPLINRILGAVSGAGFNPANTGRGARQASNVYGDVLLKHGLYQDQMARNLLLDRAGVAGDIANLGQARESARQFDVGTGAGFRGEAGSIYEALLAGAPPGSSSYFKMGENGPEYMTDDERRKALFQKVKTFGGAFFGRRR